MSIAGYSELMGTSRAQRRPRLYMIGLTFAKPTWEDSPRPKSGTWRGPASAEARSQPASRRRQSSSHPCKALSVKEDPTVDPRGLGGDDDE